MTISSIRAQPPKQRLEKGDLDHQHASKNEEVCCDRCGCPMFRMRAVYWCDYCGYKTDCCGH